MTMCIFYLSFCSNRRVRGNTSFPRRNRPVFELKPFCKKKNARQAQTSGRPFGAASRLRFVRRLELILLPSRGNALRLKARGGWWKISRQ